MGAGKRYWHCSEIQILLLCFAGSVLLLLDMKAFMYVWPNCARWLKGMYTFYMLHVDTKKIIHVYL